MAYRKARQEWTGKDGGLKGLTRKAAREGKGREGDTRKKSVAEAQGWYRSVGRKSYYGVVKIMKLPEQVLN